MGCGKNGRTVGILAGILLVAFGCLLQIYWETLLDRELKKNFILSATSKTFEAWMKAKPPVYSMFYFFNWTNPEDLSRPGYKPTFQEVGPYAFTETLDKEDVLWHDNGTLSYRIRRFWHFQADMSNGSLSDMITSANPIAVATDYMTRYSFGISTLSRLAAPESFRMTTTKTVEELLFKGYNDKLINIGRFSQLLFGDSEEIPYDRFGWWYPRNGSLSEVYNVQTGANGMDRFGDVSNWRHNTNSGFFSSTCGAVRGSAGTFFGWNKQKTNIELFTADLCRFIQLAFKEELSYHGLTAYRYEVGPSLVDNGTLDERTKCFCTGECVPFGAFNVSTCSKGAPVFISYPHFTYADPFYTDSVIGMKPDPKEHNIYLILEPKHGVPLEISARIQINLLMDTTDRTSVQIQKRRRLFFPVLWVDQKFQIPEADLRVMIRIVHYLPVAGFIASIILIVWGTVLSLGCFACRMIHTTRKVPFGEIRQAESKLSEENHNIKFYQSKDSNL